MNQINQKKPLAVGTIMTVQVDHANSGGYIVTDRKGQKAFLPRPLAPQEIAGAFDVVVKTSVITDDGWVRTTVSAKMPLQCSDPKAVSAHRASETRPPVQDVSGVEVGSIVKAKVVVVRPAYALVDLANGHRAILHVSEISAGRTASAVEALSVGDTVVVRIVQVDAAKGGIAVSRRAVEAGVRQTPRGAYEKLDVEEGRRVEFKTSLIYDPGTGRPSAKQVYDVARVIASLMNTDGGDVYLGVNNQGLVKGCGDELDHLGEVEIVGFNGRSDQGYSYGASADAYRRKIRFAVQAHLDTFAWDLVDDPEVKYDAAGRMYVRIRVKPAPKSKCVCCGNGEVCIRTGDETTRLEGRDLVNWLLARAA